jgi:hypothetical protein
MTWRGRIVSAGWMIVLSLSITARGSPPFHQESESELNAKIQQEKNPIKRAKLEIKLFHIELLQAINSYDAQDLDQGVKHLDDYQAEVEVCWKTLQSSGEIAAKHASGFKEFDIALRENMNRLNDLSHRVSYLDGGPIRQVMGKIQEIRNENLVALFPTFNKKGHPSKRASDGTEKHPVPHSVSQ